jgi:GT2 family glycosyltransferase
MTLRAPSTLHGTSAAPPTARAEHPDGLSLILITYNREGDIQNSLASLETMASTVLEIIVVNNASTDGTAEVLRGFAARIPNLRVIEAASNLGVAGGRNRGMREARGGLFVFLDDDAEFLEAGFAAQIAARFKRDPLLGALGFRIVDGEGAMRPHEFPHPNKSLPRDQEFLSAYFVGAGHAIRRAALEVTGLYPEEFFYSQEELYLCTALVESGYHIAYCPAVTVRHWQSNAGRFVSARKWFLLLRNTLLINHRFLPMIPYLWSIVVWSGKVAILSRSPRVVWGALREYSAMTALPLFRRRPLQGSAYTYLRHHGGRVWW